MKIIFKLGLAGCLFFTVQFHCNAQSKPTVWTIWKPTEKLAYDLFSTGYELKSTILDSNSGWDFGYLEKGGSVFRCALVPHDLRFVTLIDMSSYKCVELTKPFQSEGSN
jgi:hypothetical protein